MSTTRRRSALFSGAALFSAAASFATLPLTTRVIGARAYGLFGFAAGFVGLGVAVGTLGSGYLVYNRLPALPRDDAGELLTATGIVSTALTAIAAALLGVAWATTGTDIHALRGLESSDVAMAVAAMLLTPVWIVAIDVLTLDGRAELYATAVAAQTVANVAATLIGLYALDLRVGALFLGNLAGAAVAAAFSLAVLVRRMRRPSSWSRLLEPLATARSFLGAQLSDAAYSVVERTVLAGAAGVSTLGLYTHSQRYRDMANLGVKSVARAVWPTSLAEARTTASTFSLTERAWAAMHAGLAVAGVAVALLARPAIDLVTHGRFTPAADYVPAWFVLILLQSMEKPQTAILYARARAAVVARLNLTANVVAVAVLAATAWRFGAWGALVALLAQAAAYDLLTARAAGRLETARHVDAVAWCGMALVVAVDVAVHLVAPTTVQRLLLAAPLTLATAWIFRRPLSAALPGGRFRFGGPRVAADAHHGPSEDACSS